MDEHCDAGARYVARVRAVHDTTRSQSRPRKPWFRLPRVFEIVDGWNFCLKWLSVVTVVWMFRSGGLIRLLILEYNSLCARGHLNHCKSCGARVLQDAKMSAQVLCGLLERTQPLLLSAVLSHRLCITFEDTVAAAAYSPQGSSAPAERVRDDRAGPRLLHGHSYAVPCVFMCGATAPMQVAWPAGAALHGYPAGASTRCHASFSTPRRFHSGSDQLADCFQPMATPPALRRDARRCSGPRAKGFVASGVTGREGGL